MSSQINPPTPEGVIQEWVGRTPERFVQINASCTVGSNGYDAQRRFEVACLEPRATCRACGQPMLKTKPKCRNHSHADSWHPVHVGFARTLTEACAQVLASIRGQEWPLSSVENDAA